MPVTDAEDLTTVFLFEQNLLSETWSSDQDLLRARTRQLNMVTKSRTATLIEVTGALDHGRLVINLGGHIVRLPQNRAVALLSMIVQRRRTKNGYTHHSLFESDKGRAHTTISRLRDDLDEQLKPGAADCLFEEVGRSMYRLIVLKEGIVVQPEIRELVPYFLPADLVDALLSDTAG